MTVLKESLHGFVFESNRGTRVTMTANSPLGPQFNFGWNNKKGKKFKSKTDVTKDRVSGESIPSPTSCISFGMWTQHIHCDSIFVHVLTMYMYMYMYMYMCIFKNKSSICMIVHI